ncbi:MAG TPA: sugar transferase [Oscillospiraceae bacterium]|nr:sugar transferase [Oscillospiraceae bacterium]HPS34461.1 sugar transferase [Oscillospiraceae bacterium]
MYHIVKRILDFLAALIAILLIWPFFLLIMAFVALDSKGPVFFVQKRVKKAKKLFNIYKFRTMRIDTPKNVATDLLGDPQVYITGVGRFLRKYSLDELPQLFNILRGDMSVVGPRPALFNQYDLIEERDRVGANSVRPGLTGWAQINGRDELTDHQKAEYDGEYVKKLSFGFDLKCCLLSVKRVFMHEGVKL